MSKRLSDLQPGQKGRITHVGGSGAIRRRYLDLGLVVGTEIAAVRTAPLSDPIAYQVRGYQLAMRRADAADITIELL